jgi:predicted acetyltransferase
VWTIPQRPPTVGRMSEAKVRPARDEGERLELERVLQESFGIDDLSWTTWMERIGHENLRVVEEAGAIRGGLGFYRFGQFWGGARVPMIGLAGVGVAPDARGRGLARKFLVETLAEGRAEGIPLAGLFASSVSVYRSVGFEQAGSTFRYVAPIASLPAGDHALTCEPLPMLEPGTPERRAMAALYEARARRWSGHLDRSDAIWARIQKPYKGVTRAYRFGPKDAPEGYVVYAHSPGADLHFAVVLKDLVLETPAAARRCLALLSDLRSLGSDLRWLGCASDPLVSMLPEQTAKIQENGRWMLRILDVPRALAMRGYAADGEARFGVRDALFGELGVRLVVKNGKAEVEREPFDRAPVRLDTRALASLYTGFAHPTSLRSAGLIEGDLDEALALSRLFAGPEPWLCDWF